MQFVRKMHFMIREKLCGLNNEQIDNESKIAKPWCPDRETLLKDFVAACPLAQTRQCPFTIFDKSPYQPKGLNNTDMAGTQFSFIAFVVLFPQDIGIHDASDEDLEAFCHMWRCYGYLLGMQDEYNFCRGHLEEIKQRARDIYRYSIIPNFKNVTPEWEHMTRCFIKFINFYHIINLPYKVVILIVTKVLNMDMPNIYASLSYTEWITYKTWTYFFRYGLKISCIRAIINTGMRNVLDAVAKKDSEKSAELKKISGRN